MGTQGGWTKYAGNPVLGNKSLGTCFDVNVIRVDGVFRMYFSWRPRKSLAVCHSSDGIIWDEPREVMLRTSSAVGKINSIGIAWFGHGASTICKCTQGRLGASVESAMRPARTDTSSHGNPQCR